MPETLTVELLKPAKGETVRYRGEVLRRSADHVLVHARWDRGRLELPYVTFEPGDHFFEHYYLARYYNAFEVRSADGRLKGWYCNFCRPARLEGDTLTSEDLELDAFVPPDRGSLQVLDRGEFERRDLDPATRAAVLAALADLEERRAAAAPPFDSRPGLLSLGLEG